MGGKGRGAAAEDLLLVRAVNELDHLRVIDCINGDGHVVGLQLELAPSSQFEGWSGVFVAGDRGGTRLRLQVRRVRGSYCIQS